MNHITKKGKGYADSIGHICVTNYLPYVGKIVNVSVENGETYTTYEPATLEESRKARKLIKEHYESKEEQRVIEAQEVVWELWQQSWIDGVPEGATIFCDAHQRERLAHGSNRYDELLLCNDCVGQVERQIAERVVFDIHAWTHMMATNYKIHNKIDEIEAEGYGVVQLDATRWLEVTPLYKFVRNLKPEKDHYPHPDIYPTFYEGWVRDDKEPGIQTIYFTSRNRLFGYLLNGGKIQEEKKAPHPLDDEDDDLPHSMKDLLEGNI